ncbi:MAG TPA: molybdate ABC transporter substrate-binding protein [Candidatus Acidoferrum sp.]|nr:molybdate ABC transporter substrate-binding protein [Candidatus Acidoferrum sp.]
MRVAAASDLQFAMQDLAAQFERTTGIEPEISYGSSGNFYSQLQSGAPFDLFFSADAEYPARLQSAGLIEPGTLYNYAIGRLAIWMPADSPLDLPHLGWKTLLDPRVEKIAIANPDHAPYGRAALDALRSAGLYDQVKSRLVFGENISQTAQFVQSGNAQAGIIALSLALSPGLKDGLRWEIPAALHPPIVQSVVILKSAANPVAARAFEQFVKSAAARETLARYGFTFPANSSAASHHRS